MTLNKLSKADTKLLPYFAEKPLIVEDVMRVMGNSEQYALMALKKMIESGLVARTGSVYSITKFAEETMNHINVPKPKYVGQVATNREVNVFGTEISAKNIPSKFGSRREIS
jgi:predicted transcriptional regulator